MISVKPELECIFQEISDERTRQDRIHPNKGLPLLHDTEMLPIYEIKEAMSIRLYALQKNGCKDYHDILVEEFYEAFLEEDREAQIAEFIQVAAVAVRIVEGLREGKIKEAKQ
jgi:hypothetical protein